MELSKYIKSESVKLNRSVIHFADYKPIDGYNGKYIISTSGDIIRLPYSSNSKYTQWRNNKMNRLKKYEKGYYMAKVVSLYPKSLKFLFIQ